MAAASASENGITSVSIPSRPRPGTSTMRNERPLACVQCQRRKIKCNRESPCSHCIKTGVQCVPANLVPRQRRRRFPERELLDRLRHYEDLLEKNHIDFEPLHPSATTVKDGRPSVIDDTPGIQGSDEPLKTDEGIPSNVNMWSAITMTPHPDEDHSGSDSDFTAREMGEKMIKKAWEHSKYRKEDLIFGTALNDMDLSVLHPEPAQIFKLWQVYLDNVDPLLKVTHTPTLQPRIINATGSMTNVEPTLHALMFAIYGVSVVTLEQDECWTMFAAGKEDLLGRYHFGCQQALLQAAFLRTEEIECLTALYLYMISMKPDIDARALSSSLGIAIRIAQRMNIHDESSYRKYSALEAELRRRLWWSLIIFDNRMCEMSNSLKSTMLLPTWDCKLPSNVNDFDLRSEAKALPRVSDEPSQAVFAVVRAQVADYLRHGSFYLDFNIPALKALAKKTTVDGFENDIETRYLQKCNPEDPLHYMTIWTTRGLFAKNRFWHHLSKFPRPNIHQTDAERDIAIDLALRYIECDTKLLSSPLTERFLWYTKTFTFFPACIHVIQDLRKRPLQSNALRAWEVMSADWKVRHRFAGIDLDDNPFFKMFARIIALAWEGREAALAHRNLAPEPWPGLVAAVYAKMPPKPPMAEMVNAGFQPSAMDINLDDLLMNLMPMPIDFMAQPGPYDFGT